MKRRPQYALFTGVAASCAGIFGAVVEDGMPVYLEALVAVALGLIIGGLVTYAAGRYFERRSRHRN